MAVSFHNIAVSLLALGCTAAGYVAEPALASAASTPGRAIIRATNGVDPSRSPAEELPGASATQATGPAVGWIAGTVRSNNSAVANATIRVWWKGKDIGTIPVDPKGEFHFPLPEGTYEVQASAPHFRPAIAVRITVVVHPKLETWVNLVLVPVS